MTPDCPVCQRIRIALSEAIKAQIDAVDKTSPEFLATEHFSEYHEPLGIVMGVLSRMVVARLLKDADGNPLMVMHYLIETIDQVMDFKVIEINGRPTLESMDPAKLPQA